MLHQHNRPTHLEVRNRDVLPLTNLHTSNLQVSISRLREDSHRHLDDAEVHIGFSSKTQPTSCQTEPVILGHVSNQSSIGSWISVHKDWKTHWINRNFKVASQNQGFQEVTSFERRIRYVADEHIANMSVKCDGPASGSDHSGLRPHITTGTLELTDRGNGNLKQFQSLCLLNRIQT